MNVLVLPSDESETWGLVVNEAYQCGTGAIVSDRVGCGPDLVESVSPDFVFLYGDADAISDSLSHFQESPPDSNTLKNLAAEYSLEVASDAISTHVLTKNES